MNPSLFSTVVRALASAHFDVFEPTAQGFPSGAYVVDGDHLVVYRHDDAALVLGPALLIAGKQRCTQVSILVGSSDASGAGLCARQTTQLSTDVSVFVVDGKDISPAVPTPDPGALACEADSEAFRREVASHGLETVVEAGLVRGELLGLEVARFEHGAIQVGVGRFDREAGAMIRGTGATDDALGDAIALVRPLRQAGALSHPLNRLARERWLRSVAMQDPSLLHLASIESVETVAERVNLLDPFVAGALGLDADGASVVVGFAAGVDTTAISHVADLVARHNPQRVVVAMPSDDLLASLTAVFDHLRVPTSVIGMAAPWPR